MGYPGVPRCTQVHPGAPRCTQVHPGVPRCTQVYRGAPRCTQVYPGVPTCTQVYPGVPGGTQVYPRAPSRCTQVVYPGVPFMSTFCTRIRNLKTAKIILICDMGAFIESPCTRMHNRCRYRFCSSCTHVRHEHFL